MPLLTPKDLAKISPVFKGRGGEALGRFLIKALGIKELSDTYESLAEHKGQDFAENYLKKTGAEYHIGYAERLDSIPDGPFITISNHPYGGIDGLILIDLFGHQREDYKVMVNKLLGMFKTLDSSFITVTPTGEERTAPTPDSISGIRLALKHIREGHPLGLFPSGAVSDLSIKDRCIRDREWQEAIIRFIRKARVPVIPVRFFDGNSRFYYSLGLLDWKIRLLRLPQEAINKKGRLIRVGIGETISVERQDEAEDFGKMLRDSVYNMKLPETFTKRSELWK